MKQSDKPLAKELLTNLLQFNKLDTILNMQYARVKGYEVDGRIRTQQQVVGTETGRLNSRGQKKGKEWWPESLTNLQNITNPKKFPKLNPLFNVRKIIVPDPGCVFIAADLGKAELFGYLAYAGDHEKIAKLHSGCDIHLETASAILGVSESQVSYAQRAIQGKFANFSLGYGGGWQMFRDKVNKDSDLTGLSISAAQSKSVVDGWRAINPLTVRWWDEVKAEANRDGYLVNAYGRKRIFLSNGGSGNDVIAHQPQSTIADHLNHALVRLYDQHDPHDLRIMLQVHDEILVMCPKAKWLRVARIMKRVMTQPLIINGIEIHIPVEVSVGFENWGTMREIKV